MKGDVWKGILVGGMFGGGCLKGDVRRGNFWKVIFERGNAWKRMFGGGCLRGECLKEGGCVHALLSSICMMFD